MGKNGSKNFINQFKNTRRLARRRPLVGQARLEQGKIVKGPARRIKKLLPGERKNEKNPNRGDK